MEIDYQCTLSDFLEVARQKKSFLYYFYWVVGVFFLFTGFVSLITGGSSQDARMFVIAGVALAWPLIVRPISLRRQFRTIPNFVRRQRLFAGEEGLRTTSDAGRSENNWSAYTEVQETKNLFVLYMGQGMFEVIPKRAFSPSERDQFRGLLARHLPRK
jgi:YcxB-like protein